ncbi:phage tail tape measure protein [Candidatus Arsenophonus nilaparvatae]|uniref:phage tail tape measure protein n=1 Tax=Candidatus Arsenophonus nilaparvatae TaxID=1247023 RepID=UPI000509C5EB|nr:phage tail tape measure protein [Candidatus Arsenophonus nilaparvatae]
MSSTFSIGVVIKGAVAGAFRSAMGDSRRSLNSLSETTHRLQSRQQQLTQAVTRYGQLGVQAARSLNSELGRVGQTLSRLGQQHHALMGRGLALGATTAAAVGAVAPSVKQSMTFQDNLVDMGITAGYDGATQAAMGNDIRAWSQQYNQTQSDLQAATSALIGNNIDSLDDIRAYLPHIARGATATRTSAELWAQAAVTTQQSLGIAAKDFAAVQNIMAQGGKAGSFEIADQVKWLPELAPKMKGIAEGKEAVAELVSALQIARMGAGTSDEAANNLKNFLEKVFAPETQKRFADVGIDIEKSLMQQKVHGISPIEGMMNTLQSYLAQKSPEALAQFKSAMALQDDTARDKALLALQQNFGLGELFADMQVMAFVRPMLANMDKYRQMRADDLQAADKNVLLGDYKKRLASPIEQMKKLGIASQELSLSIGESLSPAVLSLTQTVLPYLNAASGWVKTHPQLVSGIAKTVGALLLFKGGLLATRLAFNLLGSPIRLLWGGFTRLRTGWLLLQSAFGMGGRLSRLAGSVGRLGKVLAGGLVTGLRLAGHALLWLGRALMFNPIGLTITAIAAGAYLIYHYWTPISAFFQARWAEVKQAFSGGIADVGALILNGSPLGLLYKAFAGVMGYFNIELPAHFTDAGRQLIEGLVNGIKSRLTAAKETIVNFGDSVSGWFKETLGIHSPSRVFAGLGDNIVQGAVVGITRTTPALERAVGGLMPLMQPPSPRVPHWPDTPIPPAGQGKAFSGIQITFAPQIVINGQSQAAPAALREALAISVRELEKRLAQLMHQQQRRDFY